MLEFIAFLACLEFAVLNSAYHNNILKPKQVICLESIYLGKDVICILPTGYGKSLIFHLTPMLMFARDHIKLTDSLSAWKSNGICTETVSSIVIVVSPLNSLIQDQISRLKSCGLRASAISINVRESEEIMDDAVNLDSTPYDCDLRLCEQDRLLKGQYHIVFAHPESIISTKFGRGLILSKTYKERVVCIVIDEAHCILDW